MASSAALQVNVQEMSRDEIDAAMREIMQEERCRVFREMVEEGRCGFCRDQTLRVIFAGSHFRLTCICNFTTSAH